MGLGTQSKSYHYTDRQDTTTNGIMLRERVTCHYSPDCSFFKFIGIIGVKLRFAMPWAGFTQPWEWLCANTVCSHIGQEKGSGMGLKRTCSLRPSTARNISQCFHIAPIRLALLHHNHMVTPVLAECSACTTIAFIILLCFPPTRSLVCPTHVLCTSIPFVLRSHVTQKTAHKYYALHPRFTSQHAT